MRVLISFTPEYASYGGTLARGLRTLRPGLQTRLVPPREAWEAAARFGPHLVISDGAVPAPGAAEARISAASSEPSEMRLGGAVRPVVNPTLQDLLRFIDEVGRAREGRGLKNEEERCSRG